MGAVIMKMMRRTRTTSMNGTMLISEREDWVDLGSVGMGGLSVVELRQVDNRYQRTDNRRRGAMPRAARTMHEILVPDI
jgi:hypothetical protein